MTATDQGIDCLNSLLRGELAATETYQQAIAKMTKDAQMADLWRLHAEHREAANLLRQHVHECGGKPDQSSGVWGAWAKFVEGAAKVFGVTAALQALKEGENQGIRDYETALRDHGLAPECITLIRSQLLPQTREHVLALERLKPSM